jgi:predicted nucleic acid-binding protein
MNIVVDTSVILAVITNEPHREQIIDLTRGAQLFVPPSIYWEIGNAFSAMFKRGRITLDQAIAAVTAFERMELRYTEVALAAALQLAQDLDIYAYDAYILECARQNDCSLMTLDNGLRHAASQRAIPILEIMP